jgi:hypothetical protein
MSHLDLSRIGRQNEISVPCVAFKTVATLSPRRDTAATTGHIAQEMREKEEAKR